MKINLIAFGIAKAIFKTNNLEIELTENATTNDLKFFLENKYPRLKQLSSYMIAINNEYSADNQQITSKDEIAIIPPVSGG